MDNYEKEHITKAERYTMNRRTISTPAYLVDNKKAANTKLVIRTEK
jgi:hypothetical protein